MDFKTAMALLAVAIMLSAYCVNLWKTYVGKSEPHPLAWVGFGLLTGIGFLIQRQEGAGAGSWVMGWTAIFCFLIAGMSEYRKRWRLKDFSKEDWAAFAGGIATFAVYLLSLKFSWGGRISAVLATLSDILLYVPIVKHIWHEPESENATAYFLNSAKFVPALFAMGRYSLETCLYPAALIVANSFTATYAILRRKWLSVIPDDFAGTMMRIVDVIVPLMPMLGVWLVSPMLHFQMRDTPSTSLLFAVVTYVVPIPLIMAMNGVRYRNIDRKEKGLKPLFSDRAERWLCGLEISNTYLVQELSGGMLGAMTLFFIRGIIADTSHGHSGVFATPLSLFAEVYALGILLSTIYRMIFTWSEGVRSKYLVPLGVACWFVVEMRIGHGAATIFLIGVAVIHCVWTAQAPAFETMPIPEPTEGEAVWALGFAPH